MGGLATKRAETGVAQGDAEHGPSPPSVRLFAGRVLKAATIRDVAERAGVSVASVSRVLNGAGPVASATRDRVTQAVDDLQYVPHSGARSLSTSRTQTIGVVLPDLYGEFFSELIRGMDLAARPAGYHLIVSSSHDDAEEASAAIRSMRGRVDGLIVLSPHLDAANLASSLAGRTPVLMMNGQCQPGRACIEVDNHGGARMAVEHLVAQGRRRIAHVCGPSGNLEAEARLAGYLEAMVAAGLEPTVLDGDFTQTGGEAAGRDLAARTTRPDAVFAANDIMAIGAMLALQEQGLRVPEDVAVVGFDDVPIAALVRPGLTTVRIPIVDMGRRAVQRIVAMVGGEADSVREVTRPDLIFRASSGASATPPRTQAQHSKEGETLS